MSTITENKIVPMISEMVSFIIGEDAFAIAIDKMQGINRVPYITKVNLAPDYVKGLINLRGQIVAVIDLAVKLYGSPTTIKPASRILIVKADGEVVGFLVDEVLDVVEAEIDKVEASPANLSGMHGQYIEAVYRGEDKVVGVLDVDAIISVEV